MQRWIPAALMAATLGGATTAHALQMKLTRTELCSVADTVAVVDIVDLETRWAAADNGGIERIAFADVTHAVRGTDNSVQITLPGGTIGEVRHWVEDVPSLLVGGIFDGECKAMTPSHAKRGRMRLRYSVTRPDEVDAEQAGLVTAQDLERLVSKQCTGTSTLSASSMVSNRRPTLMLTTSFNSPRWQKTSQQSFNPFAVRN